MAKYGTSIDWNGDGKVLEWYQQSEAFSKYVVGKTAADVEAMATKVVEGAGYVISADDALLNAGCTILVSDFAIAVEKAINSAVDTTATANDTLKLGVATSQTATDATAEAAGSNKLETYLFAAAVDANGKVVAASSDCVEATFEFDATGKASFDATKEILSKKEQGADYGMVAYGGAALEWFEQAAAFDAVCVGKTPAEIAGLVGEDGRGTSDVQSAGCTIYVTGFVKAATSN
jgi:hypothetical protein